MSEKTSRRILIAELIILVLPLAFLMLAALVVQIINTVEYFEWYNIVDTLLASIACVATFAGLYNARMFIRHGSTGLHNVKPVWWLLSILGVALVLAAGTSKFLPPAPEYSREEIFRNDLELFLLGLPFLVPFIHLLLERFIRKSNDVSAISFQRNNL